MPDNGVTVLVVDDEAGVRELVRFALKDQGYHVFVAGTADEALALCGAAADPLDLLILDLDLNGKNSHGLAEAMGRLRPGLPVLFISGQPSAKPVAAFLGKPFTLRVLVQRVREMVGDAKTSADPAGQQAACAVPAGWPR